MSILSPNQGPKASVDGLALVMPSLHRDFFPIRNIVPGKVQGHDTGRIAHAFQVLLCPYRATVDKQGRIKKTIAVSYSAMKVC